jgi:flagellar protein FlaG
VAFGKADMVINSLQPNASPATRSQASAGQAAENRQALQAAKSVNESGILGENQLVFMVDRQTHRPVFRIVDRNTHQVISQIPPEYVLRLAQDLGSSLTQGMSSDTDT